MPSQIHMPRCDRCYGNDRVSEARGQGSITLSRGGTVKVYWCERCRHRFTKPSEVRGVCYYDGDKAHILIPNTRDSWIRAPELDVRRR